MAAFIITGAVALSVGAIFGFLICCVIRTGGGSDAHLDKVDRDLRNLKGTH